MEVFGSSGDSPMTTACVHLDGRKLTSLAIIPLSLFLIAVFTFLNIRTAWDPIFLVPVLNTLISGIIPVIIAFIAFRGYRSVGSVSLFMMGSGMLIFGLGQIAAGWVIVLPDGYNMSVTISNVCVLLFGGFTMSGALLAFTQRKNSRTAGSSWKIAGIVFAIIFLVAMLIVSTMTGLTPKFFIVGVGPTILRQVVLSYAITFLTLASLLLFSLFTRQKDDFFFWYAISLAAIAIGFLAAIFTFVSGSPVSWVARGMLVAGAIFALAAVIVARRRSQHLGFSLEETLGLFFIEAEEGYKSLIEAATDAIVVFDSGDRVIVWNRAAETMFGYSQKEALGSSFFNLAIPDEFAGVIRNNFLVPATVGEDLVAHKSVEIMARRKDGSRFPAGLSLSRHMVAGTLVSTAIIRNLTDQKRAETKVTQLLASVEEEKRRLSALVSSIPDEVWFADVNENLTLVNPSVTAEFGKFADGDKVREIAGSFEVYRPDMTFRPIEEAPPLRALKGEVVHEQEEVVRTPSSGELRYRQVNAGPVKDAEGKIIGSVSVVRDITAQKKAEATVIQNYRTFSELIEGSPFGIYIIDSQFRIAMMNAGSQKGAFRNVRPIIGRDFSEAMHTLWPDEVAEEIIGHFRHTLQTGEPYYSPRFTNLRHDIKIVESYEWELHRMALPDGQYGVICYYFDSTALRNTEEKLRANEISLKQILGEKEVLLEEIHHRVKNNLAAFISLLSLEGSTEDSKAGRELKKDLQNRARSMALIHETLYRTHKFSEVDMEAYLTLLVDQIVDSYASRQSIKTVVEAKGVALDLDRASPAGLIVNELVTNSLKHGFPKESIPCLADQKDPCTIGIRFTKEDGTYLMNVYDNGVGMQPGFDPLTANSLGLKLVTFLAKHQMRAKIEVISTKGTEFIFRFKE